MSNHNSTYEFPDDFVESLVCSHCKACLSCGPIKVKPNGETICGRCSDSKVEGSIRHSLFEAVLAKFTFPCRFKKQGCGQQLMFGAVEHEDACPYHTFACPSLPHGSCTQNVSALDVYKHFEEAHDDLIVKNNKFRLDLQADVQCNLLASTKEGVAAVQYMYDSDKQDWSLDITHFSNDPKKRLSYKLQIVSGSDLDRTISFKDYSCRRYECHAINQQSSRNFKLSNYLPALEHPTFVFVNIMMQCVDDDAKSQENYSQMGVLNSLPIIKTERKINKLMDVLEGLRCRFCDSIEIPPLYRAPCNRIGCHRCQLSGVFRAATLVKIPEFPCCWRRCSFVGNEATIGKHTESCQFQTYICPLLDDCFSGCYTRDTMISHIQQHGGQFCANPERIVIDFFCQNSVKKYFAIFNNQLIAFTCSIQKKNQWTITAGNTKFSVDIYFEHEHCSFKSKTFSYCPFIKLGHDNRSRLQLPVCFLEHPCIWAVLKIRN